MRSRWSWVCVGVLIWCGCGRTNFLGTRYENFSAYYNTYYNAERSLEEGIIAFEEGLQARPIDQDVFLVAVRAE